MKCCICGKEIEGYGNNPYPLCDRDDYDSRCCDECDGAKVIPARMMLAMGREKFPIIQSEQPDWVRICKAYCKKKCYQLIVVGGDTLTFINDKGRLVVGFTAKQMVDDLENE